MRQVLSRFAMRKVEIPNRLLRDESQWASIFNRKRIHKHTNEVTIISLEPSFKELVEFS